MTEQCGTPAYIAPEILRDEGYYGFAVDIWSSGVVFMQCFTEQYRSKQTICKNYNK